MPDQQPYSGPVALCQPPALWAPPPMGAGDATILPPTAAGSRAQRATGSAPPVARGRGEQGTEAKAELPVRQALLEELGSGIPSEVGPSSCRGCRAPLRALLSLTAAMVLPRLCPGGALVLGFPEPGGSARARLVSWSGRSPLEHCFFAALELGFSALLVLLALFGRTSARRCLRGPGSALMRRRRPDVPRSELSSRPGCF